MLKSLQIDVVILAAGLGTRLQPITKSKPKALVEVAGKTLLEHTITKLKKYPINNLVINTHHFPEQIVEFLEKKKYFNLKIRISDESKQILDTGGGIKKAISYFKENNPILIHNVDIISNFDICKLIDYHLQTKSLISLLIRNFCTNRYFLFDTNNNLAGWGDTKRRKKIITRNAKTYLPYTFSAIQILSPMVKNLIFEEGTFSLIELYLRLSKKHTIKGYKDDTNLWLDVGTIPQLKKANKILSNFS